MNTITPLQLIIYNGSQFTRRANTQTIHIKVQNWNKNQVCHTKRTVLDLFNVQQLCTVQTTVDKNIRNNLQFMILRYQWPWNRVKVIKPGMNSWTQSKVLITQSFKDLPLTVSAKKLMLKLLSNQKTCQLSPLNMCKSKT